MKKTKAKTGNQDNSNNQYQDKKKLWKKINNSNPKPLFKKKNLNINLV